MRKFEEIFHNRLERIREELNSYIDSHLPISENNISAPAKERAQVEKKKGGAQEKFLKYTKYNAAEDEGYFDDEVDECLSMPEPTPEKKQPVHLEAPRSADSCMMPIITTGVASRPFEIPDILRKDGERPELDEVLAKKEESFSETLLRMIDEKGLKDSDVYKRANIDRRLFSKIRADEDYMPSRKTAISFCLALQLELEEARKLLATAGYTLSSSSRFDLIIMYLIENCEYNIHFANIVLDDYGEGTLSR